MNDAPAPRFDWKRSIRFWLFVLAGSMVTTLVNSMLGIDLSESVGMVKSITHNVLYMAWGAIFYRYCLMKTPG